MKFFDNKRSLNPTVVYAADRYKAVFPVLLLRGASCWPGHAKTCIMPYANNKRRRSACTSAQSDQQLCCSLRR